MTIDRRIRRSLAKGFPDHWVPPQLSETTTSSEPGFLLDFYHALFLSNQDNSQEALTLLRRVRDESKIAQIRARAAQGICELLLANSLDRRYDEESDIANRFEAECRSVCERALSEFKNARWSSAVTQTFHAALGVFSYYNGDRLTAKFHLSRAIEQYSEMRSRYDKRPWTIALAYYYSGVIANESDDHNSAIRYLSLAAKRVPENMKPGAIVQLASALLKSGDAKGAKRIASRGLASRRLRAPGSVNSELKGWLAEAHLKLGDDVEAARLFGEIIEAGNEPRWEARAVKWLKARSARSSCKTN